LRHYGAGANPRPAILLTPHRLFSLTWFAFELCTQGVLAKLGAAVAESESGQAQYELTFHTGSKMGAGTDSVVCCEILGAGGASSGTLEMDSDKRLFAAKGVDAFQVRFCRRTGFSPIDDLRYREYRGVSCAERVGVGKGVYWISGPCYPPQIVNYKGLLNSKHSCRQVKLNPKPSCLGIKTRSGNI
jgi:hypothetical protein